MLLELLTIMLLATIPACFNYFLDYCFGKPLSNEPNPRAIFFKYSFTLALNRLKRMGIIDSIFEGFQEQLRSENPATRQDGLQQYKLSVLLTAQKYFGLEQALGLCMFCTNFWVSLLAAGVMFVYVPFQHVHPLCLFLLIPIFSHSILRKI